MAGFFLQIIGHFGAGMVNQPKKIITKSIDDLLPYINNARTHSDEQVSQIAASIKEFGFNNPVLISDDGSIIAGHGRVMAAKKLGLTELPCLELSHLSDIQRKAYILADNKLALNSSWDYDLLKLELHEINDSDFKIDLIGFKSDELKSIMFDEVDENEPDEFKGDVENKWQILLVYENENDLANAYDEFTERGLKCKIIQ
jgi:ParB-like chromosome segregation protein Spo0J